LVLVGKSEGKSLIQPSNIEGKIEGTIRRGRRRKQWNTLSGKLALVRGIDLSQGRLSCGVECVGGDHQHLLVIFPRSFFPSRFSDYSQQTELTFCRTMLYERMSN
jgi:hypothetical protein